ncbi:MAG: arylsulfotransferase family protein [Flavobacteriaceae bacterium]
MKRLRILFIIVAGLFFYSMLLAALTRNIYLNKDGGERWGFIAKPVKFIAEIPSLAKQSLKPGEFLVVNDEAKGGLDLQASGIPDSYPKLLVSYKDERFGQKFELVDLHQNKVLKSWEPDNALLFDQAYNETNPEKPVKGSDLYFLHPLLTKDSALILSSQLTSLLVKVNKNNEIDWLKNDKRYHHSTEFDLDGNVYSCTRSFHSNEYDFLPQNYEDYKEVLMDDEITKIDPDTGETLFTKSVLKILVENGYERLLLGKGQFNSDPIHLNDIQPALTDSPYWKKGDLLISCRNLSTVFLYRPSTDKILWLRRGPWYNQHDADFLDGDKIVVFGNDVIREESVMDGSITKETLFFSNKRSHNDVYIYNFEKDSVYTPYSRLMKKEEIKTYTSGRCDVLPNGDVFVEDTNNGRIIFGDSINTKIEYVRRIDDKHISSLFWSRLIY